MATNTKLKSFISTLETAPTIREQIREYIEENPHVTRSEIAAGTSLRLSSVCGRVRELLKRKDIIVVGHKYDPQTDRQVETLMCLFD